MRFFLLTVFALSATAQDKPTDPAFFESRVRPVLAAKCYACHGPANQYSDLRLDSREAISKGGQRGPAAALIPAAIRHAGPLKMPPAGPLSPAEASAIEQWLHAGFPWPNAQPIKDARPPHWAFQPLKKVPPQPIDAFLKTTSKPADKRTLARRAAYVVTGLPPKPEVLNAFLNNPAPNAWPNYIDALLASPRYGEKWARHWLDLMRFAETYGYEWNYEIHGAWRYRDYLIRAFNQDLPFHQFIREHVAGDLLPSPRLFNNQNESTLATAFWRFGEMGHDNCNQFREIRTDVVDNQIDTLTKSFQGLTVSCARCHDHKFDPIPTADYYALYGIINSSRPVVQTLNHATPPNIAALKAKIKSALVERWLREAEAQTAPVPQLPAPHIDFSRGIPPGWSASGLGLSPVRAGDFALGPDKIEIIFPNGLATNQVTAKWNGTLRSPILPRDKKFLSIESAGANAAAHRTVMDHCVIGEDHKLIEGQNLHLEKVPTRNDQPLKTYLELNTLTDNPRLPERPGKFKTNPDEKTARSWFVVTRAWYHNEDDAPKPETVQHPIAAAIRAWSAGQATEADIHALNWALNNKVLTPDIPAPLAAEYQQLDSALPAPAVANAMADVDPGTDHPILLSGNALNPGRSAPRHFLSLLPESLRPVDTSHSGRLQMAEAIASPQNPLTARVYVNRIWRHVFGKGLVEPTDNFGRLTDPPANPDLLDHLANTFLANNWSTKKLIRELLLTQAFQAENQVRRLEAEAIRDTLLAVSGRLDETMYGPSIQPRRKEPTAHRRLFQGPLDGDGRRSIYLKVTRMEGPKFLEIFDFPAPLQTRGNRDATNVPTQSLAMLNDPFVHQQARHWADRLPPGTFEQRLTTMFETALLRPPTASEVQAYKSLAEKLGPDPWPTLAHTLFNSKQFLYLH